MQVKKFEAPTIQEALETIKRELGPEAIILQTKKNKKGFGLMSKDSVEVTAAVSERSLQKKGFTDKRLPEQSREQVKKLPADRQADLYDRYHKRHVEKAADKNTAGQGSGRRLTATRYIEIETPAPKPGVAIPAPKPQGPAARAQQEQNLERAIAQAAAPAGANAAKLGSGMSVEEEVRHLKRMIEELKSAQDDAGSVGAQAMLARSNVSDPAFQDAFEQLVVNGVDKRYAFNLIKKASFELGSSEAPQAHNPERILDQIAGEIMLSTEVLSPLAGIQAGSRAGQGPSVIALVGPTGVGKTTTVAKMASEAILRRNLKVGLINLDSYKVAAFDQLGTYAKILNVPFRSVATVEDLKVAVQDFQGLDLVLIDTTGRSQRDPESLKEMQAMLQGIGELKSQLVLSATTRDAELYDMASRFAIFKPQGIIVSKLDEATIFGSIYNVCQRVKLPLLYFTTGQRVPEDIEEATRERVAALILDL